MLLQADPETGRLDWPRFSDQDLNALERACCYYANTPEPAHERELHALLAELQPRPDHAPARWLANTGAERTGTQLLLPAACCAGRRC